MPSVALNVANNISEGTTISISACLTITTESISKKSLHGGINVTVSNSKVQGRIMTWTCWVEQLHICTSLGQLRWLGKRTDWRNSTCLQECYLKMQSKLKYALRQSTLLLLSQCVAVMYSLKIANICSGGSLIGSKGQMPSIKPVKVWEFMAQILTALEPLVL